MKKRNPGRNNCRPDVRWKKCALKECIKYESWKDDEKIKRIVGDRDVTDADSKYSNRGLSDAVIRQLCGLCRCHPVSYTHLDVYKRQSSDSAGTGIDRFWPD